MKGWRLAGVIVFALLALMELGDFAGLIPGFSEPGRSQYAALIGISPEVEGGRLAVLSVLALMIVISAIAVVIGLVRRSSWVRSAAIFNSGAFFAYGVYQAQAAATQVSKNQVGVAIAGGIYICIGVLAIWLGRKAAWDLRKP